MDQITLQSPGSILFHFGPITIRWYGIMIALAFVCCTGASTRLAKRWGLDSEKIFNLALVCFLGGVVGARLYYVALSWDKFRYHLSEIIFNASEGLSIHGLSIHGGMIGALVVGLIYCRRAKLPMLLSCDVICAGIPLGQAIGRWGNFFNSEAFGLPVSDKFPLRLYIPNEQRPPAFKNSEYFHPTFLYEATWNLALFFLLYFVLADRLKKYPGLLFCLYVAGYSIGRLLIEPIRTDSIMMPGSATPAPIMISALMLLLALVGVAVRLSIRPKQTKMANHEPESVPEVEQRTPE